ncbi:hypothetical protein LLG95_09580 [bacterium]|nr:hypothetical protein [bacterium]
MKNRFAAFIPARLARVAMPLIAAVVLTPAAWADRIVTDNDRTLEGVIQSQNEYYININVRGTLVPVPRSRIREIVVQKPNENVRLLLDKANESLRRNQASVARAQLEQARALNATDQKLRDEMSQLDRKIVTIERSGGTPEERRHRAQDLLREAKDAYDRVQNDLGNEKLIEALRTDPSYDAAHTLIDQKLNQGNRPNLMLAAEYFAEALWPDNLKSDSTVIPMLPKIYSELAERFGETTDAERASRYYDLQDLLSKAFVQHPEWVGNDPELKRMIEMPMNDLMADLIGRNIAQGQYQTALDKLHIWMEPGKLPLADTLYARADIGQKNYAEAARLLDEVAAASGGSTQLQVQAKAARRLVEAQQNAAAGKTDAAIATLETVFYTPEQMIPEIREAVGQRLAELKGLKLKGGASPNPWLPAEVAALNLRFAAEQKGREDGYSQLRKSLAYVPWRLDAVWSVNGNAMTVQPQINDALRNMLSTPMQIQFNANSPFTLRMQIDLGMSEAEGQVFVQSMETGNKANFPQPLNVTGVKFSVDASYPALPPLLSAEWNAQSLLAQKDQAKGIKIPLASTAELATVIQKDLPKFIAPSVRQLPARLRIPEPLAGPEAKATPAAETK